MYHGRRTGNALALAAEVLPLSLAFEPGPPREGRPKGHLMMGCIAALCLVAFAGGTHAATLIEGRIVGVHDGDTVTLLDADHRQHRIRLDGIDAPESGQSFGRMSKQHLAELMAGREALAECSKLDRYGREVCRVLVGSVDVGLAQIRAGMAWYFRRYANELAVERQQQYADVETQAKAERRGLWADAERMPPWEWRARRQR